MAGSKLETGTGLCKLCGSLTLLHRLVLTVKFTVISAMHLTAALHLPQVATMTEAEFDALWKHYINAFAALLVEAGGDLGTAAGRRLTRLVYEVGVLKGSVLMSHPSRIRYKLVRRPPPRQRSCMPLALQLRHKSRVAAKSPG